MPSEYLTDTTSTEISPLTRKAHITDRWSILDTPNGGYLLVLAAKAMAEHLPHKCPLTVTGHYHEKTDEGEAILETEVIKERHTITTAATKLRQGGVEKARFTGTYTTLPESGYTYMQTEAPTIAAPEECVPFPHVVPINHRFDLRFTPETAGWITTGETTEQAELYGWNRFSDGTEPDIFSLLLFADATPPAVFARTGTKGWVPTIELTVHIRQKPAKGWLKFRFRTRFITNDLLEEDGELWDSEGKLVAISRQMAKLRMDEIA